MDIAWHPEHKNNVNNQIKKRRKKTSYKKISNEARQKLVEMDAAKILNINYSTAKTILRIFRIEKRIEKKNAEEEKQLKNLVTKILSTEREKNDCPQLQVQKNLDFVIMNEKKIELGRENQVENCYANLLEKNYLSSGTKENSNENLCLMDKTDSLKEIVRNLLIKLRQNDYRNYSLMFNDFTKVATFVDECYRNIKNNQNYINFLMDSFHKINHYLAEMRNRSILIFFVFNLFLGLSGCFNAN